MTPTQAIINCADLAREASKTRHDCAVTIERTDAQILISATNGWSALRYVFRTADWPREPIGCHTLRDFPRWGKNAWAFRADGAELVCEASTAKGRPSPTKDARVARIPGRTETHEVWDKVTGGDRVPVKLPWGVLQDALEPLQWDAEITLVSGNELSLVVGRGPLQAPLGVKGPGTRPIIIRAGGLEDALTALEDCGDITLHFPPDPESRMSTAAPLVLRAGAHSAMVGLLIRLKNKS